MKKRLSFHRKPSPLFWVITVLAIILLALLFSGGSKETGAQQPLGIDIRLSDGSEKSDLISQTIQFYHPQLNKVVPLDLEDYVIGVVAAEMPASFESEALKAQAVAARTLAVYKMQHGGCNKGGDICGYSNHCQAWVSDEGMRDKWGDHYEANLTKIKNAVQSTAGEIIEYGGEPIQVLYHSTSGGMTEDVENVFANALPYLRAVTSEGEENTSHYESTQTISKENFYKILKEYNNKADETKEIRIVDTFESGRVDKITAGGILLTGKQMRTLYDLDSTLFTVTCSGNNVTFHTKGFGHGVGMSQTGANAMAKNGSDYLTILHHYYTDVEISGNYGAHT